jgi:hypothetical protein
MPPINLFIIFVAVFIGSTLLSKGKPAKSRMVKQNGDRFVWCAQELPLGITGSFETCHGLSEKRGYCTAKTEFVLLGVKQEIVWKGFCAYCTLERYIG